MIRTVFFGNHTVGVEALKALLGHRYVIVTAVVAHPIDPEDGVVYESVYKFADKNNIPVIRGKGRDAAVREFVHQKKTDLIWITDYRYILPLDLVNETVLGAVNLHPSLLPTYRGRAPINWAIINGETRLGLTCHWVDEGVDTGNIIKQLSYDLSTEEDVGDALNKLYPLYRTITRQSIDKIVLGQATGNVQVIAEDNLVFAARKPKDGLINWHVDVKRIFNLIRAVSRPYPGAFSFLQGRKVFFWKTVMQKKIYENDNGTIVSVNSDGSFVVAASGGSLLITDYEFNNYPFGMVKVGDVFTDCSME